MGRGSVNATSQCRELLIQYPALGKYADEACLKVLNEAHLVEIAPGTIMFQEASPCKNFMWLLNGSVRVFKNSDEGREVTVYRVSPGELCLLSLNSLFGGDSYPASAKSETRNAHKGADNYCTIIPVWCKYSRAGIYI